MDRTADEIFDDHLTNFTKQQINANRLQKEFNNYIRCIRGMYDLSCSYNGVHFEFKFNFISPYLILNAAVVHRIVQVFLLFAIFADVDTDVDAMPICKNIHT